VPVTPLPDELVALRVTRSGSVSEVLMIGPGKGNTMGPDFWRELPIVFRALDADPEVRAVVLAGSGGNFSYGLDLNAMLPRWADALYPTDAAVGPRTTLLGEIRDVQDAFGAVSACRKPVVAAVSGWCVGGGVDLIAAADIRLASADATFSVRETAMGIVADGGSLQRLPAIIGEGHTRELAFTGRNIDASRAHAIGLVNDVHPTPDDVLAAAHELAAEIAANPPLVVQGVKDVLNHARDPEVTAGLRYVSAWNAAFLPSEDLREAVEALRDRRRPEFRGR
jgi:enoyl-CoA hydratase